MEGLTNKDEIEGYWVIRTKKFDNLQNALIAYGLDEDTAFKLAAVLNSVIRIFDFKGRSTYKLCATKESPKPLIELVNWTADREKKGEIHPNDARLLRYLLKLLDWYYNWIYHKKSSR